MIRLKRPDKPDGFEAQVTEARAAVEKIVAETGQIESRQFNSYWWKKFKPRFESHEVQGMKCGYCEGGGFEANASLEMEHFHPKTTLSELPPLQQPLPRAVCCARDRGTARSLGGFGYWWLAYEWDNWLLSCEVCNGHYKGTLFPVANLPRPPVEKGCHTHEQPLLLNPFDDDPLEHLDFDDDGFIEPRGGSVRGSETIRTCGLNRDTLQRARLEIAREVIELLEDYELAGTFAERDVVLDKLRMLGAKTKRFAGVVRCILWRHLGEREDALFETPADLSSPPELSGVAPSEST